jgi:hypothetical protein
MTEHEETRQEEQEQVTVCCCPVCGEAVRPLHRPRGMAHMRPWGMGHMGPWGAHGRHPGHWLHEPKAMVWAGVVPALLGFTLGYMMASIRTAAMYAYSEKRGR